MKKLSFFIGIINSFLYSSMPLPLTPAQEEFYHIIEGGEVETFKKMVDKDIGLLEQDLHGQNPIHIAAFKGHLPIVQDILKRNPTFLTVRTAYNIDPLQEALLSDQHSLVHFLLHQHPHCDLAFNLQFAITHMSPKSVQTICDYTLEKFKIQFIATKEAIKEGTDLPPPLLLMVLAYERNWYEILNTMLLKKNKKNKTALQLAHDQQQKARSDKTRQTSAQQIIRHLKYYEEQIKTK